MKQIYLKNICLLSAFFLLGACGIETPQALPKLFAPNGVFIVEGANTPSQTLRIRWWGINPEEHFSGYNIYYAKTRNDALNLRGRRIPNQNLVSSDATTNILLPFFTATEFEFVFNRDNHGKVIQDDLRNGGDIFFWVRAYSKIRGIESEASIFAEGLLN